MSRDEEQIRALVEKWHAATRAGDVQTVLSLMTDDVVFLVAGRPPMRKEEFAALSRAPAGAAPPKIESSSEIQEIHASGDLAFAWTRVAVSMTPPGADRVVDRAGYSLTIFRRVGGQWLLARDANLLSVVQKP